MVEKARHYIHEGDIFQVVLSNPMTAAAEGSLFDTYRVLRTLNPSPYMFYFTSDDVEIAGASPETLTRLTDGTLYTFPLAGTRPRGKDKEEDEALERELLADEKELSEHNMLVDLGRNDLGRVSRLGSVQVETYASVVRFSHVMHIGSTVRGDVIFHSDHGENLGDHGMYLKGPYFYENNVHVPLIISWPGKIPGGRKSKALIELADLAPTICEAAGLPLYEGFQGKSFWKILTGESDLNTHRDSVYSEFYNSNINHRNPLAFTTMVCDGRYKLTKVHGCTQGAEGELYDLQEKPLERYNYYNNPAFTEIKVRMLELLADRMAQTCDPLPTRKACW